MPQVSSSLTSAFNGKRASATAVAGKSSLPSQQTFGGKNQAAQKPITYTAAPSSKLNKTPRFGATGFFATLLAPTAIAQLGVDTLGVYAPKLPLVRSKAQFFEETYLELIEDLAFYLTVPAAGYGFAKLFKTLFAKHDPAITQEALGTSFKGTTSNVSRKMLGMRGGILLAALGAALGFEYLIQHTKNIVTDKIFHIQNFSAIAGLEGKTQHSQNEFRTSNVDPVEKGKRRIWQTAIVSTALVGSGFALPKLAIKSDVVANGLRKGLRYLDFGKDGLFDLQRFAMSLIITSGVISYLDAARDWLERKETAMRLAVIVPYLILGKPLVGNLLASGIERFVKVGEGAERKTVGEHLQQANTSLRTGENPWKKFRSPGSFFELDTLRASKEFIPNIEKSALSKPVQNTIIKLHKSLTNRLWSLPLAISALISGIGINAIDYKQTKKRFDEKKQQDALAFSQRRA